jgi:hypothetical protein
MARKLKARIFEFENALEFGNFFETFLCRFLGRFKKWSVVHFVELGTNLERFLELHTKTFVHLTAFENLVPD